MKHEYHINDGIEFEDSNFVNECLQAFDEGVVKIESEYAVESKSA